MTAKAPRPTSRRTLLAGMALMATAGALPRRTEADPAMKHVVLLGDSIFDNKRFVGDGPDVIKELSGALPAGWQATLNAVEIKIHGTPPPQGEMQRLAGGCRNFLSYVQGTLRI